MGGERIKHEGIIGIRGMRQLDLDRLFLGLRSCLWARHGRARFLFSVRPWQVRVISLATAKRLPGPGFGPSRRDFPPMGTVNRRQTEENVRFAGVCVALGRAISCKGKTS